MAIMSSRSMRMGSPSSIVALVSAFCAAASISGEYLPSSARKVFALKQKMPLFQ